MATPAPLPVACPECSGERMHPHYDPLTFDHNSDCPIRSAEDSRHMADRDDGRRAFRRQATSAERALLAAFGQPVPSDVKVRVEFLTAGMRRRRFTSRQAAPLTPPAAP